MGIAAIVYSSQVSSKIAIGDYAGATEASNKAKMWNWISFGSFAVLAFLGFLIEMMTGQ